MARTVLVPPSTWESRSREQPEHNPSQHSQARENTGPHLEDLPNEILDRIIENVDTDANDDLLNLARCSSRFHRLAEPILYTDVLIRDNILHGSSPGSLPFLCRILARPDLARRVRFFHGAANDPKFSGDHLDTSGLTETDRMRICTAVRATSCSEQSTQEWIESVAWGSWDSIMALILSVVPNLEELNFEDWGHSNDAYPFITQFFDRAANLQERALLASPFSLRNLRRISLVYWDTENGYPVKSILPFLKLKSLRAFYAHMVSEGSHGGSPPEFVLRPSTYTTKELTLSYSVIHHEVMIPFFRSFPALERLHYEYGGACVNYADFEPPRMMAALKHLKPCLREITILGDEARCGPELESYLIGSFADFEKLTSIDAVATAMLGISHGRTCEGYPSSQELVDSVPRTLEALSLRDCGYISAPHLVSQVSRLVSQKAMRTPALKRLNLGWEGIDFPDKPRTPGPVIYAGFTKEEAEQLMTDCVKAGIEMKVKWLPPKPKFVYFSRERVQAAKTSQRSQGFCYPYEGYEKCCKENGCDLETGRGPASFFF